MEYLNKYIFNVILAFVACVCMLVFYAACPLSMECQCSSVFLCPYRGVAILGTQIYNHFLIFVMPPNNAF